MIPLLLILGEKYNQHAVITRYLPKMEGIKFILGEKIVHRTCLFFRMVLFKTSEYMGVKVSIVQFENAATYLKYIFSLKFPYTK